MLSANHQEVFAPGVQNAASSSPGNWLETGRLLGKQGIKGQKDWKCILQDQHMLQDSGCDCPTFGLHYFRSSGNVSGSLRSPTNFQCWSWLPEYLFKGHKHCNQTHSLPLGCVVRVISLAACFHAVCPALSTHNFFNMFLSKPPLRGNARRACLPCGASKPVGVT
eukprot:1138823-Pelagomonas_calceolata.AAC.3